MSAIEWRRRAHWAAHAWRDGKPLCSADGTFARKRLPHTFPQGEAKLAPLSPHGVPFGRVCQICLRRTRSK